MGLIHCSRLTRSICARACAVHAQCLLRDRVLVPCCAIVGLGRNCSTGQANGVTSYPTPVHVARATVGANTFQTNAVIMTLNAQSDPMNLKVEGGMTNEDLAMEVLAGVCGYSADSRSCGPRCARAPRLARRGAACCVRYRPVWLEYFTAREARGGQYSAVPDSTRTP
jgi:hypothetical protein